VARDKDRSNFRSRRWYHANLEISRKRSRESQARRRKAHPRAYRQYNREWIRAKLERCPWFRMVRAYQTGIRVRLKYFGASNLPSSVHTLTGCTDWEMFVREVQATMAPSMKWDNYGSSEGQWEVHHLAPLSLWDMSDPRQVLMAGNICNLRACWSELNGWRSNRFPEDDRRLLEKRIRRFYPDEAEGLIALIPF
jgi:hypothetical protein